MWVFPVDSQWFDWYILRMYITAVPNRGSRPTILLRESRRVDGKVKNITLANLTCLPEQSIALLKRSLAGEEFVPADGQFEIARSLPHGHVAATLGTLKSCGLWDFLADRQQPDRQPLAAALIVSRLVFPASKLATAASLHGDTAISSLGHVLGVTDISEDDLYATIDWLLSQQDRIERRLARKHLTDGTLVLYDVSSSYLEGRTCPLAQIGYSRDGKKNKLQIVYGLLCSADGCPVAVEVFDGNTADPNTLASQVEKLKNKFGLSRVVLVGDRGMITSARIREDLAPNGIDWLTALRTESIRALAEGGALQLSLFDERDLAEVLSPDFANERLVACRNPLLAAERARKREDLLAATEKKLQEIADATQRSARPLTGKDRIGVRVGKVIDKYKVGKHFDYEITNSSFTFQRKQKSIDAESSLDGIYVLRTSVSAEALETNQVVSAYKDLRLVERAFRCLKSVDLAIRPVYHRLADRVRGHVFLCMLAYYVEWHMRQALAPLLYEDHDRAQAEADRKTPVAKARRSQAAAMKDRSHKAEDGTPVTGFRACLQALGTLSLNTVVFSGKEDMTLIKLTSPTPFQVKVFDLLGVKMAP